MADKKSCTALKKVAVVFAAVAILLGIASFLTPPRWIIDASVIAFAGEIFAFVSLFFAWESVDRGIVFRFGFEPLAGSQFSKVGEVEELRAAQQEYCRLHNIDEPFVPSDYGY